MKAAIAEELVKLGIASVIIFVTLVKSLRWVRRYHGEFQGFRAWEFGTTDWQTKT